MDRYHPDDDYEGPEDDLDPREELYTYATGWDDYEDYGDENEYEDDEDYLNPYGDLG